MVNGIGGVFIKATDPKFLSRWYEDNLGIGFGTNVYFSFKWRNVSTDKLCVTDLSFYPQLTTYFYPSDHDAMLNLRVDDLDTLRLQLKKDGFEVPDKVEAHDYGRFGWVIDPEGNKIELWEAVDEQFPDLEQPMVFYGHTRMLGGVFIKCFDPKKMSDWYSKYFGLFQEQTAHIFNWKTQYDNQPGSTVLSFFPEESEYFSPSTKRFMLNFCVQDLNGLLKELKSSEVPVIGEPQTYEYGMFAWIMDPDGNKVELWEPKES